MKKSILLLILVAFTVQSYSQEFAPIGSIWHFTQWTINPNVTSFKTIESVSDTLINGIACKKLIEVERYFDTTNVFYHYMYSANDSVFFYADGDFQLLYDFGAIAGDTLVLNYFSTWDGSPLKMIIDSTGTLAVNGVDRKIQYITCGDGIVIEFGQHVIDGIGNTSFMFPTLDGTINGPLRCYQDESTSLFLNPFPPNYGWNQQDCDEIINGIDEIKINNEIGIYPIPAQNSLRIKNVGRNTKYKIFDLNGVSLKQGVFSETDEINITNLSTGVYFMEIETGNRRVVKIIIKR